MEKNTDAFSTLNSQETARRVMEIAIAGGHALAFEATEGDALQWSAYNLERLSQAQREAAQQHIARFTPAAPYAIGAGRYQRDLCAAAATALATACGSDLGEGRLSGEYVIYGEGVPMCADTRAISMADLILPPPLEPIGPALARIERGRARQRSIGELEHGAAVLLDSWKRHCNPTEETERAAIQWARTIEALYGRDDGYEAIRRISLAEALSYCRVRGWGETYPIAA